MDSAKGFRHGFPESSGAPRGSSLSQEEAHMTNEGTVDRAVRIVLGLGILSLAFVGPRTPWAWLGVVPLLTGLVGFCPAYRIFGISTCPAPRR